MQSAYTGREAQIPSLIAMGLRDKEIAVDSRSLARQWKPTIWRLFQRRGLHSRAAAVAAWLVTTSSWPGHVAMSR
jgi:DNA-binding NarL/FixJ family response regulator